MLRGWRQRGANPWISRWMDLGSGKSWMLGSDAWDASRSEMLAGLQTQQHLRVYFWGKPANPWGSFMNPLPWHGLEGSG